MVIEIEDRHYANERREEVRSRVASEHIEDEHERDEDIDQRQPVGTTVPKLLDEPVCVVINVIVDHSLLELMELGKPSFEQYLVPLLSCNTFKRHPDLLLSLMLKVQELIGLLQLLQVQVDVLVVVNVLHDLGSPFAHLLVVHELLTIEVVEQDSDPATPLVFELEPELLDFERDVVHVLSQVAHRNYG